MAMFTVQNLSGLYLAVPEPVARLMKPGATAEVEAASLDTDAIADLINDGLLGVIPQAGGSVGHDAIESASKSNAGFMTTCIGEAGAGFTLVNGQTLTFTHNLGTTPLSVLIFDDTTGELLVPDAGITIGGTANTVTIANATGGNLDSLIFLQFAPGTSPLGAVILATDSRLASA